MMTDDREEAAVAAGLEVKESGEQPQEEVVERGTYSRRIEYVLSLIGFTIGLGNIQTFPYQCYENGGGTYLIPYLICYLFIGFPILYLELALGQFVKGGSNMIFSQMAPILSGVGWAMASIAVMIGIFYNVLVGYIVIYFFLSFNSELPWSKCRQIWNTNYCFTELNTTCNTEMQTRYDNGNITGVIYGHSCYVNGSTELKEATEYNGGKMTTPANEYFTNYVQHMSSSISERGELQWRLVLAMFFAYVVVFLCVLKGVKSIGKVVYFTATVPYVLLTVLLINGLTLDGSGDGLNYYLVANWTKLGEPEVWVQAAKQVMFSLGIGTACVSLMASFAQFRSNCFKDAVIISLVDTLTSFFCGFTVFPVIGFLAKRSGKHVRDVVDHGPGLVFVVFPEALSHLPHFSTLFSILFFFTMFTMAIDTMFVIVESLIDCLIDGFPGTRDYRFFLNVFVCLIFFLLGCSMCYQNGIYVLTVIATYFPSFGLFTAILVECVAVSYIYGLKRFKSDLEIMLGVKDGWFHKILGKSGWYWLFCFAVLSPMAVVLIFVAEIFDEANKPHAPAAELFLAYGICVGIPLYLMVGGVIYSCFERYRNNYPWVWLLTPLKSYRESADDIIIKEENARLRQKIIDDSNGVDSPLLP